MGADPVACCSTPVPQRGVIGWSVVSPAHGLIGVGAGVGAGVGGAGVGTAGVVAGVVTSGGSAV